MNDGVEKHLASYKKIKDMKFTLAYIKDDSNNLINKKRNKFEKGIDIMVAF